MPRPPKPRHRKTNLYDHYARSLAQRVFLVIFVGAALALALWILLGSGISTIGVWFCRDWQSGSSLRCYILAATLAFYYLRLVATSLVYLKRGMRWSEALVIAPWLLFIYLLLAVYGALNPALFAAVGWVGVALFLIGSGIHTWAEHQRHTWKRRQENEGHLYTQGLFRFTRHPNYLGDLLLFTGLCLICGRWITALIPILMLCGFLFANIPTLDRHLHQHYGDEFARYAARTRKLIPFIY